MQTSRTVAAAIFGLFVFTILAATVTPGLAQGGLTPPAASPTAAPTLPVAPDVPMTVAPTGAAPATQPVTPGVLIRLKFKVGEILVYRIKTETTGTMTTQQGAIPLDSRSTMDMTQTVESIRRSDGAARIVAAVTGGQITMMGRTVPLKSGTSSLLAGNSVVIDSQGRVLSMNFGDKNPISALMNTGSGGSMFASFGMPDGPVHIGDRWTRQSSAGPMGAAITADYTVSNIWTENGKRFVAIHSTMSGSMSSGPSSKLPLNIKMSGPIDGTGDVIFDATGGIMHQTVNTSHVRMNMSYAAPANSPGRATGSAQNMTNDISTTTTIQLVRVEQN